MEGSEKRYFFAAAFNGKHTIGNGSEEVEKAKGVLKKKIKKLENSFGSLKVKFTFAAAKNKKSSLTRMGVKLRVCDPVTRKV